MNLPALPRAAGSPGLIAVILLITGLGFGFWFAFMPMVAAMVDDPNTSSRSGLLMLPSPSPPRRSSPFAGRSWP